MKSLTNAINKGKKLLEDYDPIREREKFISRITGKVVADDPKIKSAIESLLKTSHTATVSKLKKENPNLEIVENDKVQILECLESEVRSAISINRKKMGLSNWSW